MAIRRLLSRTPPEAAEPPADRRTLLDQAVDNPLLAPVRLFWEQLNESRAWWPVLVPALLWVGWRTYRRERAAVVEQSDRP
jgi:hypothetical protein